MSTMFRSAFAMTIGAALIVSALPALAASYLAMDLKELADKSDSVVRGEVLSVRAFWDADHRTILAEAHLRVDERLRGDVLGSEIAVRSVGGKVGDHEILAHGFPKFEVGEEVLLFLRRHEDQTLHVTGYQLGHFLVEDRGGVEILVPTLDSSITLVDAKGNTLPTPEPIPMAELREQIRLAPTDLD